MAHPLPVRHVLGLERVPVDPAGHHHQHPGEVLQRVDLCGFMDLDALHGHLHPAHFSGLVAPANQGTCLDWLWLMLAIVDFV